MFCTLLAIFYFQKQVEALIFPSLPPEVTKPDQTYSLQLRLDVSQIQTIH